MANPAQAIVDRLHLLRSRFRLRRAQVEPPTTDTPRPSPAAADRKQWTLYYDKALWPARDYEEKGVQPHG